MLAPWRLVFHQTLKEIAKIKMKLATKMTLKNKEVLCMMERIKDPKNT
jgi:hypothetical protein